MQSSIKFPINNLIIKQEESTNFMKIRKNSVFHHQPRARLEIRKNQDGKNDFTFETKGVKSNNNPAKENEIQLNGVKYEDGQFGKTSKIISLKHLQIKSQKNNKEENGFEDSNRMVKKMPLQIKRTKSSSIMHPRKTSKKFQSLEVPEQFKQPFLELEESLKKDHFLEPLSASTLKLKRERFHQMVLRIVKTVIQENKVQNQKVDPFIRSLVVIKSQVIKQTEKKKEFGLVRAVYNIHYTAQEYRNTYGSNEKTLEKQRIEKGRLDQEIMEKKGRLDEMVVSVDKTKKEAHDLDRRMYELQQQLTKENNRCRELQHKRKDLEKTLELIEEKYDKMLKFVTNQEKNTILKDISKDYLEIQAQIYEYASYLQCNQLANDVNYEPHPFTQIEKHLQDELTAVCSVVLKSHDKTAQEKNSMMVSFLHSAMNKMKKKDVEMSKLNEFKTKCILNFVGKMKKWLNNWQLKQQYLVNLKKQYVAISIIFKNSLNGLSKHRPASDQQYHQQIAHLLLLIDQLQLNFSLGNSFY